MIFNVSIMAREAPFVRPPSLTGDRDEDPYTDEKCPT